MIILRPQEHGLITDGVILSFPSVHFFLINPSKYISYKMHIPICLPYNKHINASFVCNIHYPIMRVNCRWDDNKMLIKWQPTAVCLPTLSAVRLMNISYSTPHELCTQLALCCIRPWSVLVIFTHALQGYFTDTGLNISVAMKETWTILELRKSTGTPFLKPQEIKAQQSAYLWDVLYVHRMYISENRQLSWRPLCITDGTGGVIPTTSTSTSVDKFGIITTLISQCVLSEMI